MFNFLPSQTSPTKRIYLDYAAATPVRPEVRAAMQPYFSDQFGNPSAIHEEGQQARKAVEDARLATARLLGVRPEGVTWTASGTEANNLALYGRLRHLVEEEGKQFDELEIITTEIEHPSITEVVKHLERLGVKVKWLSVTEEGIIDVSKLKALLSNRTAFVTFAYVNSEIGVIQPVKQITRAVRLYNQEHGAQIMTHLDAAQAPLWLSCKLEQLGVDMLALDAGKCFGPKGVGVLARKHGVHIKGVVLGGGQEGGLRAGTENTPLIVGAATALQIAQSDCEARSTKVVALRDYLIKTLEERIPEVVLNGSREQRVANNVNISIPSIDSEYAVVALDVAGIACSTKSACGSGKGVGSAVVRSISADESRATSTIRFSLGEETIAKELEEVVKALQSHLAMVSGASR